MDIGIVATARSIVVEILDTGPGIPPSLLPRVFDRFFRASAQEEQGSGIGLAIVKAIAERESAKVMLANREDGPGLRARVVFGFPDPEDACRNETVTIHSPCPKSRSVTCSVTADRSEIHRPREQGK